MMIELLILGLSMAVVYFAYGWRKSRKDEASAEEDYKNMKRSRAKERGRTVYLSRKVKELLDKYEPKPEPPELPPRPGLNATEEEWSVWWAKVEEILGDEDASS